MTPTERLASTVIVWLLVMPLVKLATACGELTNGLDWPLGFPPNHLLSSVQFPLTLPSHFCATKLSDGVMASLSNWAHGFGSAVAPVPDSPMTSSRTPE